MAWRWTYKVLRSVDGAERGRWSCERHIQTRHKSKKRRHVFADGPAVVDGDRTRTWAELYDRCARLGDALRKQGCGRGDVVQCMLDNTAEMVEAQQGVAMSGATLGSVITTVYVAVTYHELFKVAALDGNAKLAHHPYQQRRRRCPIYDGCRRSWREPPRTGEARKDV